VTAVPGLTPRSPEMTLVPVLVTVEPPDTAKLAAEPRFGAVCARRLQKGAEKSAAVSAA
jgi:hypothetical protein